MEQLIKQSNKGELVVKWTNKVPLVNFNICQRNFYNDDLSCTLDWIEEWDRDDKYFPLHDLYFHTEYQKLWNRDEQLSAFDIPDNAKIIDIGCGCSIIDLLLYSYVPNSTFYLVDEEGQWPKTLWPQNVVLTDAYPHHHSWDVVEDAIITSEFNKNRFNFLNYQSEFPNDVDLIMSNFSWCWHYSKDRYWNRVLQSLKIGGKLLLDVHVVADRDIINEISEDLKSQPIMIELDTVYYKSDDESMYTLVPITDTLGYRCLWTRN
jgi:SAM-dependent methyltransferase